MWVIKLGGSLIKTSVINNWLRLVADYGRGKIVIVPGGGVFADSVRQQQQNLQFSNAIAHEMAILAMQQMALVFKGLQADLVIANAIEKIHLHLQDNKSVIWSPDINWLQSRQILPSWNITADSLAALLATELVADRLVLVKSTKINKGVAVQQWSKYGVVDKAFGEFTKNVTFNTSLLNKYDTHSMIDLMATHGTDN